MKLLSISIPLPIWLWRWSAIASPLAMSKVLALLAVKTNTRLLLATELVARNTEIAALRLALSIAQSKT